MIQEADTGWFERFPGNHFRYMADGHIVLNVCARGPNMMHPVARIIFNEHTTANGLYSAIHEPCESLEVAKQVAEQRLQQILFGCSCVLTNEPLKEAECEDDNDK